MGLVTKCGAVPVYVYSGMHGQSCLWYDHEHVHCGHAYKLHQLLFYSPLPISTDLSILGPLKYSIGPPVLKVGWTKKRVKSEGIKVQLVQNKHLYYAFSPSA